MTDAAERWERVASAFTARVDGVPTEGWDAPSPCEGWRARDIVGHLVEWVPPFLQTGAGLDLRIDADAGTDPAAAWRELDAAIGSILADPGVSERRFEHPRAGSHPLDQAIVSFILGDVFIHTWDLARSTGQDETLDRELVRAQLAAMEPMADVLAQSGQYGPRVPVADDADDQTRLIALTGRRP